MPTSARAFYNRDVFILLTFIVPTYTYTFYIAYKGRRYGVITG